MFQAAGIVNIQILEMGVGINLELTMLGWVFWQTSFFLSFFIFFVCLKILAEDRRVGGNGVFQQWTLNLELLVTGLGWCAWTFYLTFRDVPFCKSMILTTK